MRTLLALTFGLATLAAACGSSNKTQDSCDESGGVCLNTGAACGDSLPFACPSGGVCCSPTWAAPAPSSTASAAPTATAAADAGH